MSTLTPSSRSPLSAGSEIDCWCTRCKMDLGHRIVAMVGGTPKRVVCMTCGSEHNFRAPKGAATPRPAKSTKKSTSPRTTAAAKAAATSSREEWERRVRSGGAFKRYTITETFAVDDLVTHKKFGDGYVLADLGGGKLTVAFADGTRTLIHGAAS